MTKQPKAWDLELACKPDFSKSMERINAWFEGAVTDRAPIRFSQHNADYETKAYGKTWRSLQDRWFDIEYLIGDFIENCGKRPYLAETFPVFWPNLGPNWYAACHGSKLEWADTTSWARPIVEDYARDMPKIRFDTQSVLYRKLEEMMRYALERCQGRFMVGYTDLHPGIDCAAAWRHSEQFMIDLYDCPANALALLDLSEQHFFEVFDHYDAMLKAENQLSVTWMNIPCFGKLHIPSADFASMISPECFERFAMPSLIYECEHFTHNIFHVDGKGVARHIDAILTLPKLNAIQWVQGVGKDRPILQWVPFIKKVLAAGKSVVVDLLVDELEAFIGEFDKPDGLLLCLPSSDLEEQRALMKRVEKW